MARLASPRFALLPVTTAMLMALAACGGGGEQGKLADQAAQSESSGTAGTPATPASPAPATTVSAGAIISCQQQLGDRAAQQLANQCRQLSGATRPPCNVANSCANMRTVVFDACSDMAGDGDADDTANNSANGCAAYASDEQRIEGVIRLYYEALNAKDYSIAYALWGNDGQASNKSYAQFAAGFAQTAETSVTIDAVNDVEGAAGSLFATVDVIVRAKLNNGTAQMFTGQYTVRRVNGVPGATPDQLRWHIDSAQLQPVKR